MKAEPVPVDLVTEDEPVARGERAGLFVFDEELGLLFSRAKGLGIDLEAMRDADKLFVQQMDAAELAPGEFAHRVRHCVDHESMHVLVIDSLNGYFNAMPEEHYLTLHLHELLSYLTSAGVTTVLIVSQHGALGHVSSPVDVSYLADAVIALRMFEHAGRVKKAISVLKKRNGRHEESIRQLWFDDDGVHLGEPLLHLRGVLTGVPVEDHGADARRVARDQREDER